MNRIYEGASTFSKMHRNYPDGIPNCVDTCHGQHIYSYGDRGMFDTVSSLGARLFDYNSPGGMMSLPYRGEELLADKLNELIPCIEMVRYGLNGADSTEGSIRYARAYTGRTTVLSIGYHSCQSAFTNNTPPALGCIEGGIKVLGTNSDLIAYLGSNPKDVAAVIMEPVQLDIHVKEELLLIRSMCTNLGIVLIFDEIITGFRVPSYCISNYLSVTPDIILLGKAIANGHPLSIIGGRRDIMNRAVFHSYTFAGYPLAIDEAIKTCKLTETDLLNFWLRSGKFMDDFNRLPYGIKLTGYNTRGVWVGDDTSKFTLWQDMYNKGTLLGPAFFPRVGWTTEHYDNLYFSMRQSLEDIQSGKVILKGSLPQPLFKRT